RKYPKASTHRRDLRHLVGVDLKTGERVEPERGRDRDVGRVAAARHQNAADARNVMARIERVPAIAEINLEPGGEIHRRLVRRDADVGEISGAIARRTVHAAAERDGEMGKVAADAAAFLVRLPGAF